VEYLQKLGSHIAKKRLEAGLTQSKLAAAIDMDRQNMNRIEKGRTNPTILTLKMIADELKIQVKDLLDFEQ
jgi:DNA-binding XRE family transcriptional regulator